MEKERLKTIAEQVCFVDQVLGKAEEEEEVWPDSGGIPLNSPESVPLAPLQEYKATQVVECSSRCIFYLRDTGHTENSGNYTTTHAHTADCLGR